MRSESGSQNPLVVVVGLVKSDNRLALERLSQPRHCNFQLHLPTCRLRVVLDNLLLLLAWERPVGYGSH